LTTRLRHGAVALALLGAIGCGEEPTPPPVPVTVLAAASLEELAVEAAEAFQETANAVVEVRSGGTHELAEELSSAGSADVFLATGLDWMNRLDRQGLIVHESRWEKVGNLMVILGREEARYPRVRFLQIPSLGFSRMVVPDPSRDPAGRYARKWLRNIGSRGESIWQQLGDRLETVDDLPAVLEAVAGDPSAVGVVFVTDLGRVPNGKELFRSSDFGIRYSFALVNRAGRPPEAREFLEFLQSPAGVELLHMNGFFLAP
jgi:molybdate transport system substrate-binding protein